MTGLYATLLLLLALEVVCFTGTMAPHVYSRQELMNISGSFKIGAYDNLTSLRKLGICAIATHRGCKGSSHRNPIPNATPIHTDGSFRSQGGVCHRNLTVLGNRNDFVTNSKRNEIKFGLLNARSVIRKVNEITDHIVENELDLVAITETWMSSNDRITEGELCPNGYDLLHTPRPHGRGGGVALLIKSSLKHSQIISTEVNSSFEHQEVNIRMQRYTLTLIIVYRPPPNKKNKATAKQFCQEFTELLEEKTAIANKLLVVGDFNFHIDNQNDLIAKTFNDLLQTFDLQQHVREATHKKGHILDLVLSRSADDGLVSDIKVRDTDISDHYWVECTLQGPKPKTVRKEVTYRKIKAIEVESFKDDIMSSSLSHPESFTSTDEAVTTYNRVLTGLLDKHAPAVTKKVTIHPEAPWFNEEIDAAKKARRHAENTWRKTKLNVHRDTFIEKRNEVNSLMQKAKEDHYSHLVTESSDQKKLFKVVNELTNNKSENPLPEHKSSCELADRFANFFDEKITKIRTTLDSMQPHDSPQAVLELHPTPPSPPVWDEFTPASPEEMKKIMMNSKSTTCQLDPLPTTFLKVLIDVMLPILTAITNLSLKEGHVPDDMKMALILPLLKKLGLDPEILKNFRPISNLPYLSKLIERVAAARLLDHMFLHHLHELSQSSYKKFHSTETALIKIQSDILSALDEGKCVLLVMLDLSAAFDTIDHNVLISRLQNDIGLSGKVLEWFRSYISGRRQSVLINGVKSAFWNLLFGVPQGSVLGPLLFLIYMGPLGKILRSLGIGYHFYADDSQIYITFDVKEGNSAVHSIQSVVTIIKNWMRSNFLCLNEDKTELLLIASKSNHGKLDIPSVLIGDAQIEPSKQAKNIGFIFDALMDGKAQIKQICKSGWYHLSRIGRIRCYLDQKSTETLVHSFITSRLDSNNCLLIGLPKTIIHKVQILQNAAARLVKRMPKRSHITGTLKELHWLPVPYRIQYKTLLMVFKSLHSLAPAYLTDLLMVKKNTRHALRSNDGMLLVMPASKRPTFSDRNFKIAGPRLWNTLPADLRHCDDLNVFKRLLKTHLFKKAYID